MNTRFVIMTVLHSGKIGVHSVTDTAHNAHKIVVSLRHEHEVISAYYLETPYAPEPKAEVRTVDEDNSFETTDFTYGSGNQLLFWVAEKSEWIKVEWEMQKRHELWQKKQAK